MTTLNNSEDIAHISQRWPADDTVPQRLQHIYEYWRGKGFSGIVMNRILTLIAILFMLVFSSFLVFCIDYTILFNERVLSDSLRFPVVDTVGKGIFCFFILTFLLFWLYQLFRLFQAMIYLWDIRAYCQHKLGITSSEIQTITWKEVLDALKERQGDTLCRDDQMILSHLDIINIIMQQENYMIALINTDVLDIRLPYYHTNFMTKALDWGIRVALFNFVFSPRGRAIWKNDLKEQEDIKELATTLRRRFRLFGLLGLLISPFVLVALLMYFFFKYGEQVKNSPGKILGAREWSPLAHWKFREFNELPHIFETRIKKSYAPANTYVDFFESYSLVLFARFIVFILGSMVIVLIVAALYDDKFLLETEIIGSRNALLVLGVLGTALAVVREFIPSDNKVIEPNKTMLEIFTHTHYLPNHWINKAHRIEVQTEFFELFQYNAVLWITEAAGIILAPLIMIFSLPKNAEDIIEFFRKYTVVQMENMPMCSFASFDLKQLGNIDYTPTATQTTDKMVSLEEEIPSTPIMSSEDSGTVGSSLSIPTSTSMTTPSPILGNLRRRKEDDEVIIDINDEGEDKHLKSKRKGALQGTQSIKQLLKRDKKTKKLSKTEPETVLLRPISPPSEVPATLYQVQPSKHGKMEMSLLNFKTSYPKWTPSGDSKKQIENFFHNVSTMKPANVPPSPLNDLSSSYHLPFSGDMSSSIIFGDYSSLQSTRDMQIEREEAEKENMKRSFLLFTVNRMLSRQEHDSIV